MAGRCGGLPDCLGEGEIKTGIDGWLDAAEDYPIALVKARSNYAGDRALSLEQLLEMKDEFRMTIEFLSPTKPCRAFFLSGNVTIAESMPKEN